MEGKVKISGGNATFIELKLEWAKWGTFFGYKFYVHSYLVCKLTFKLFETFAYTTATSIMDYELRHSTGEVTAGIFKEQIIGLFQDHTQKDAKILLHLTVSSLRPSDVSYGTTAPC